MLAYLAITCLITASHFHHPPGLTLAHRHCASPTQNPTRRDPGCGRNALLDDGTSALIVFLPGTSSLSASLWALVPALPACSSADDLAQLPRLGFCVAALPNGQPPPLHATVGLAHTPVCHVPHSGMVRLLPSTPGRLPGLFQRTRIVLA